MWTRPAGRQRRGRPHRPRRTSVPPRRGWDAAAVRRAARHADAPLAASARRRERPGHAAIGDVVDDAAGHRALPQPGDRPGPPGLRPAWPRAAARATFATTWCSTSRARKRRALGHHGGRRRSAHRREGRGLDQHLDARHRIAAQQLVDIVRYIERRALDRRRSRTGPTSATGRPPPSSAPGGVSDAHGPELDARSPRATKLDFEMFARMNAKDLPGRARGCSTPAKARVLDVEARNDIASPSLAKRPATLNLARGTPSRPRS